MGPDVSKSVTPRLFADLTDVTLADKDSNSIPRSANCWPDLLVQVVLSGGHIGNQFKKRHLMAKIGSNASDST